MSPAPGGRRGSSATRGGRTGARKGRSKARSDAGRDAGDRHHRRTEEEFGDFVRKLHQQALESAEERLPLYLRIGLPHARRVLDVGCGSGAVTRDVANLTTGHVVAMDASAGMVEHALEVLGDLGNVSVVRADAHALPFPDACFDRVVCNLLLMWARDPADVVHEMARVVEPGGTVLASLEPDFGGKVAWPGDPHVDPIFSGHAIRRRGGDPHIGRKLRSLFSGAGLETEVGLGNTRLWGPREELAALSRGEPMYRRMLQANDLTKREIDAWLETQREALEKGVGFSFFPQFFAIGRKKARR